jgi:ABC-type branched-subunit amino acid transport system substrate-binding protein
MKQKIIVLCCILLLLLTVSGCSLQEIPTESADVTVGILLPLSGPLSYLGDEYARGITLYETDFKESPLRLLFEDTKGSPVTAVSSVNKLLHIDDVDIVFSILSGPSSAVSPIVSADNTLLIYSAFNEKIVVENNFSLKTFIRYSTICNNISYYYEGKGIDKVTILNQFSDVGLSWTN